MISGYIWPFMWDEPTVAPIKARIRQGPAADASGCIHPFGAICLAPQWQSGAHWPSPSPKVTHYFCGSLCLMRLSNLDRFPPFFHLHVSPLGWKPPLRLATGAPQSSSPKDLWKQHAHLPGGNGAFDQFRGAVYLSLTLFGQSMG